MAGMIRWALIAGALSGLSAVGIGALGAHAFAGGESAVFHTAARYHALHTVALLLAALAPVAGLSRRWLACVCAAWLVGIVAFCGSLYILAWTGAAWLGAVTPIGGTAFLLGWLLLIVAAWRDGR